jgi:predicted outer membrane repeat protein
MRGKLARTAAGTAAVGAVMTAGLGPAQVAQAALAAVQVPCSVNALTADMSSASSGAELSLAPRCIYRLARGLPVISQDLTILGNRATLERSYAPGTAAFTILTVDSGTLAVSMLNFRHGNGAISANGYARLMVNGGTFTENDGSAISDTETAFAIVNGATFTRNTAGDGGAIYNHSALDSKVTDCTFISNMATGVGGAIYDYSESFDVTDSRFYGNTAGSGGALWLSEATGAGLSDVVVRGNRATGDGGGIYAASASGLYLGSSMISGNRAGGQGGGIYGPSLVRSQVTGTEIRGNRAADGGGIYTSQDAITYFTGSTISDNHARRDGGGIYSAGGRFTVASFTGSTISGNHAGIYGGGIYSQAEVDAADTRIVRNTAASGGGGIYGDVDATVTLTNSPVLGNKPDNCEPPGSITGCTG